MSPEWDLILFAAQKNNADRIRDMVERQGVDPSHANGVGQSALHIACLWGHVEAAEALIQAGANCLAQNTMTGATPLHMAAQSYSRMGRQNSVNVENSVIVVDMLLQAHQGLATVGDAYGNFPADTLPDQPVACDVAGHVLQQMKERLQPAPPALFQAIDEVSLERVQAALEEDETTATSLRELQLRGTTPVSRTVQALIEATTATEEEEEETSSNGGDKKSKARTLCQILQALVAAGASTEAPTPTADDIGGEQAPLHALLLHLQSCYKNQNDDDSTAAGQDETIVLLEQAVTDTLLPHSTVPADAWQLMHQAARRNQVAFLQFLFQSLKLDPNVPGRQGMTALQFAARSGQIAAMRCLLDQPTIDISLTDDRGQTALDAARVNQKQEAVELLDQHMANNSAA